MGSFALRRKMVAQKILLLTLLLGLTFGKVVKRQTEELTIDDCSICNDCPKDNPNPLLALFTGGSCKQRCDLCGFCGDAASNLFGGFGSGFGSFGSFGGGESGGNLDQCRFCEPGPNDPSGSKACTANCEKGEPICKGPCKTQC